jgi:Fe-S-cluster containining protein
MRKDEICLLCQHRVCCYHYKVSLTGHDVWRIVKTFDLPSWAFTSYTEAEPDREEGFLLDQSGTRYELVLAKTAEPRRHSGCVFLVKTNDGEHRCGLGDLRPDQCRLYPVYFSDGLAGIINDPDGCCRTWSLAEIDIEEERQASIQYQKQSLEYRHIVNSWNRRVWENETREFSFYEFCAYLENRYASLSA